MDLDPIEFPAEQLVFAAGRRRADPGQRNDRCAPLRRKAEHAAAVPHHGGVAVAALGSAANDVVEGTIKATIFSFDSGMSEAALRVTYLKRFFDKTSIFRDVAHDEVIMLIDGWNFFALSRQQRR